MEEILNSEAKPPGRTPTIKAYALGKALDLNNLFLKFEGANATGTQKDRISEAHVLNALHNGYNGITVGTCGNYGASIAYFANLYGVRSIIGIPKDYSHERSGFIQSQNAEILYYDGKYEETVEYLHDFSDANGYYDASPGSRNSYIDKAMYSSIATEIYEAIMKDPDYVIVPVGNGTTLSGIFNGFDHLLSEGYISKLPRMIGVSTKNGNPIVNAFKHGYRKAVDLNPSSLKETGVNEPLISYRSFDGDEALNAIYRSRGYALYVSDEEMIRYSNIIYNSEGLNSLPASASAVAAINHMKVKKDDIIVSIITGRRS
ncbi:MAG: pyridoxal-phosphate dependent enzyme [Thermoplasmata archaeon]